MKKKIAAYLAGILSLGGLYFLIAVPGYYLFKYYTEYSNHLRHEYIQGVILSAFMSAGFWIPVSVLLLYARSTVPRRIFTVGIAPIIVLGLMFMAMNGYVIVQYLIEKFT